MPATENAPPFEQPREPNIPTLPKRRLLPWYGVQFRPGWGIKAIVCVSLGLSVFIIGLCSLAGALSGPTVLEITQDKHLQSGNSGSTGNDPISDHIRKLAERLAAEKAEQKQLAADYSAIIQHVAEPLTPRYQDCLFVDDFSKECARYITKLQALHDAKSQDAQLDGLRLKLLEALTSAGYHLDTIRKINGQKPENWEIFWDGIDAAKNSASKEEQQDFFKTGTKRLFAEIRIDHERAKYKQAMLPVHDHSLELHKVAKRFSAETMIEEPMLEIEFDEAWQIYPYNRLALKNVSGRELKRCTVYVYETDGQGGASAHIHYVKSWPADQTCYAASTIAGKYISGTRTLNHIQHLQIVVWDAQGRQQLDFDYTPERWHADVARYCQNLKFSIKHAPDNASGAGVTFNFSGMPALPPADVIVTFVRGGQRQAFRWRNQTLRPALIFDWEFRTKLWEFVPERVELALEFKDSGFVYQAGSIVAR